MAEEKMTKKEFEEAEKEHRKIQRNFQATAFLALIVLSGGAVFYHYVESLKWLDAFYFCTITLTTVGYGDIVPKTDAGKLFTIFYVLAGIAIIATFANLLLKNSYSRRQLRNKRHLMNGNLHEGADLD